jgi:hypothetical protein
VRLMDRGPFGQGTRAEKLQARTSAAYGAPSSDNCAARIPTLSAAWKRTSWFPRTQCPLASPPPRIRTLGGLSSATRTLALYVWAEATRAAEQPRVLRHTTRCTILVAPPSEYHRRRGTLAACTPDLPDGQARPA